MGGRRERAQDDRSKQKQDEDIDVQLTRTTSQEPAAVESIPAAAQALLSDDNSNADLPSRPDPRSWPLYTRYLILFCAFLTSMSFGVTQVPLVYAFRLMKCDAFYEKHIPPVPSPVPREWAFDEDVPIHAHALLLASPLIEQSSRKTGDRCSVNAIESSTALAIALLGASTTAFGIVNLFLTNSFIKRVGIKSTLLIQVFFPAVRLLIQNVGMEVWGDSGILIIQVSQIASIIGGPTGYILVLNTFITEVVEYEARTALLGRLAGSMMAGSASGFLVGGQVADTFGIKAPFRLNLVMFLLATAYVAVFLPSVPVAGENSPKSESTLRKRNGIFGKLLGPLTVFAPRKFIGNDGIIRTEYGSCLLAIGVFLGILATGYMPTLLQLYSTDVFGFETKENGRLIFQYSMLRGMFLTFAFPKLISAGRKRTTKKDTNEYGSAVSQQTPSSERTPLLPEPSRRNTSWAEDGDGNKDQDSKPPERYVFDLIYTRGSLFADGILTSLCSFAQEGWHMYLVAAVLPFAAGTGSASKGTVLQMIGQSATSNDRAEALAGISLVENIARLSTTFVFGLIFAAFANIGRTEFVFTCNAAIALLGFGVLVFAKFPKEGSRPLDEDNSRNSTDVAHES